MAHEIHCELLFDGEKLIEDARVRIDGGVVLEVIAGEEPLGAAGSVGDVLRTKFLMPGLIDAHVHVTGYVEGLPAGVPFQPMKHFARLCIYNGVTAVRDTGNSLETLFYLREWTEKYSGPRVFGSGPLLDSPPLTWPFSRIVRDNADAQREVNRLAFEGVDLIKAYRHIDPDLLSTIVGAASEHGLPVAVDSRLSSALRASAAGVRSIEHMTNVRPDFEPSADQSGTDGIVGLAREWSEVDVDSVGARDLADVLLGNGTFVVPTLSVLRRWSLIEEMINDPHLDYMVPVMPYHKYLKNLRGPIGKVVGRRYMDKYLPIPWLKGADRTRVEQGLERMGAMLRLLHSRGVKLAAGTDAPNPSIVPGFGLHQELAEMVRHGLPETAVLTAATAGAADLIGRPDLGRVTVGGCADLLLLDGNPVKDMVHLRKIQAIFKGGELIDREHVADTLHQEMQRVEDPR